MAVDLLDAPLRVTWDICSTQTQLDSVQLQCVAQQVLDAGVFFVTLEADPLRHPDIGTLLELLTRGGCQVALTLVGSPADLALLSSIPKSVKLYLDCCSAITDQGFQSGSLKSSVALLRAARREPALLWVPRSGELPLLLDILQFCAVEKIHGFKLPNQKISVNSGPEQSKLLPTCSDLEQLTEKLAVCGLPDVPQLQLEVHDLFLWEQLQPLSGGQRSEYGGCQAGNSLGHIDATGQLWPCSSWPQPFGSLLEEDLLDLWQGEQRRQIRQQLSDIPLGCECCRDYNICFGGCRGLSSFCRDDDLKRDLLCVAKR